MMSTYLLWVRAARRGADTAAASDRIEAGVQAPGFRQHDPAGLMMEYPEAAAGRLARTVIDDAA